MKVSRENVMLDLAFLEEAKELSKYSHDPSTKIGAIVAKGKKPLGAGCNDFPEGVKGTPERWNNRETKYKFVVHAEVNAILSAGREADGGTIYIYPSFGLPSLCTECCKVIIQAGIQRVVGLVPKDLPQATIDRWKESLAISQVMCDEAGIETVLYFEAECQELLTQPQSTGVN